MYNYSARINAFRDERVRLSSDFRDKLLDHRRANRDRLMRRLPELIKGVTLNESDFKPQGSFAMGTVIQTRFSAEEYDIDDGVVLSKDQLVDEYGIEMTPMAVREKVRKALEFHLFRRQPKLCTNCVRVFYAEQDAEKHHVDFPIYRRFYDANGKKVRELANESQWLFSDPTQVNTWFSDEITSRNVAVAGQGTQLRQMIQLLKRFCRTRSEWDLPNGMKLTMLATECQPSYDLRIDVAFRELLKKIKARLIYNKVIKNLAHPDKPAITRTFCDQNVVDLQEKIGEALNKLAALDHPDANNVDSARAAWDWIFKSDGFFAEFDAEQKQKEKEKALADKAALIGMGARTSPSGIIGTIGVPNLLHRFYGEDALD